MINFFQQLLVSLLWLLHSIRVGIRYLAKSFLYLIVEFSTYLVIGGMAIALISFGIATDVALWLSLALLLLILLVSYLVYRQHRRITSQPKKYSFIRVRGEVKLADWVARTLLTKAPREWTEYQDWLHDILLHRRQLLEKGNSRLSVTALTYWRLMGFCITVSAIKLKRLAVSHRRRL